MMKAPITKQAAALTQHLVEWAKQTRHYEDNANHWAMQLPKVQPEEAHFQFPTFSLETNFIGSMIYLRIHDLHTGGSLMVTDAKGHVYLDIEDVNGLLTLEVSHLDPDTYYVTYQRGRFQTTQHFNKDW